MRPEEAGQCNAVYLLYFGTFSVCLPLLGVYLLLQLSFLELPSFLHLRFAIYLLAHQYCGVFFGPLKHVYYLCTIHLTQTLSANSAPSLLTRLPICLLLSTQSPTLLSVSYLLSLLVALLLLPLLSLPTRSGFSIGMQQVIAAKALSQQKRSSIGFVISCKSYPQPGVQPQFFFHLSRFLDAMLCNLIARTSGWATFHLMTCMQAVVSSSLFYLLLIFSKIVEPTSPLLLFFLPS